MTKRRRVTWTAAGLPVTALLGLTALGGALWSPGAVAQEGASGETPHPIHVHAGTCDELGDIVAPLGDVVPITEGQPAGVESAVPVQRSETEIALPLADVLAAPHAINVHESAERIEEYIACGDVGGRLDGGELVIGLQEMNGSDFSGIARLEEDGPETEVTVYLFEEGTSAAREQVPAPTASTSTAADDGAATAEPETDPTAEPTAEAPTEEPTAEPGADETAAPAAEKPAPTEEPEAAAPAGDEVAVDIQNFAFGPDPVAIAVGDTVTWTNQDGVAHTATAEDRDALQSEAISPGDSFSQTFDETGEFAYFCEFHAGMTGTIVVE